MTPSIPGVLVILALLGIGWLARDAVIVALFASLAFGCTAIVSIGNSSPLIYAAFALLLIAKTALRRDLSRRLSQVFREQITASVACALAFYAIASAIILPRLFAGDVNSLIPIDGLISEVRLAPAPGNLNQTAYLAVGIASFLCLRVLLFESYNIAIVQRGFFAYIIANVLLGALDLGGKVTGTGDWLSEIRTAEYALIIDVEATGFWRIVGGCSEASAFAINCLASVSFTFVYWRWTGSKLALVLTLLLLVLLVFSTSSTAYAGIAVLALFAVMTVGATLATGRIKSQDLALFVILLAGSAFALGLYLYNEHLFDPFNDLIQTMVFEKGNSDSGQERSYWNQVGLQNFIETHGLGIGMGSSRSSSWFISVLSQLGIVGALLFGALMMAIFNGAGGTRVPGQSEIYALVSGSRAMALGWLTGIGVAGSSADPGLLFFLILAVMLGCKHHLRANLPGLPPFFERGLKNAANCVT